MSASVGGVMAEKHNQARAVPVRVKKKLVCRTTLYGCHSLDEQLISATLYDLMT